MHVQRYGEDDEQVPDPVRAATEPVEPVLLRRTCEEGFREMERVEEQSDNIARERAQDRSCGAVLARQNGSTLR